MLKLALYIALVYNRVVIVLCSHIYSVLWTTYWTLFSTLVITIFKCSTKQSTKMEHLQGGVKPHSLMFMAVSNSSIIINLYELDTIASYYTLSIITTFQFHRCGTNWCTSSKPRSNFHLNYSQSWFTTRFLETRQDHCLLAAPLRWTMCTDYIRTNLAYHNTMKVHLSQVHNTCNCWRNVVTMMSQE